MANENLLVWRIWEWIVVALLLVFAMALIATGVSVDDVALIVGGLTIAMVVIAGLAIYLRVAGSG